MILVCPSCQARYLVSADIFTAGARKVRCARCHHAWEEHPPKEIAEMAALVADIPPPPQQIEPIPEGSNLPVIPRFRFRIHLKLPPWFAHLTQVSLIVVGILLVLFLIFDRQDITKHWPFAESLYNTIGLRIVHAGDGLEISDVKSEVRYEDGIAMLDVNGNIKNPTRHQQAIPPLQATAIGADGKSIQSWSIDPPTDHIEHDESLPFKSTIKSPKGTVVEIHLNFIEAPHATD